MSKFCALGHCHGHVGSEEASYLIDILNYKVGPINDGLHPNYQQSTPKARILAALRDLP